MSQQGRKKSLFPSITNIPSDATFDFVSGGVNYKIPITDLLTSLNVTGAIKQTGNTLATPVLDVQGNDHLIRNIEDGRGIKTAVSPENGIKIEHNFKTGTGGAPVLINADDAQPTIGNILAGQGVSVAATAAGVQIALSETPVTNKTVIINEMADFPQSVSGVRTLQGGTDYYITDSLTTSDRFDVNAGNILFRSADAAITTFTYTGNNSLFTGNDVSLTIEKITLSAPSGSCWNITDTTGAAIFKVFNASVINAKTVGSIGGSSFGAVQINDCLLSEIQDDGIVFSGNINALLGITNIALIQSGAVYNLDDAEFNTINIDGNLAVLQGASSYFMAGLTASANIKGTGLGSVINTRIRGAGTPLLNITPDDASWTFAFNDDIRDTRTDAMASLQNNAEETTISAANAIVKANTLNTWVDEGTSQFTVDNTGRATFDGTKPTRLPITIAATVEMASVGDRLVATYVAINGVAELKSVAPMTASDDGQRMVTIWQHTFTPGDYVELYVANLTDSTNMTVTDAVLRIN